MKKTFLILAVGSFMSCQESIKIDKSTFCGTIDQNNQKMEIIEKSGKA